jgi:hypothetical protein
MADQLPLGNQHTLGFSGSSDLLFLNNNGYYRHLDESSFAFNTFENLSLKPISVS